MSDTPQDPDAGIQEGAYGYPTLEQEVTPDVLEGDAGSGGSGESGGGGTETADDSGDGDDPTPGEPVEDPPTVEPPD